MKGKTRGRKNSYIKYSLAAILLICTFLTGYFLASFKQQFSNSNSQIVQNLPEVAYESINGCSENGCLFAPKDSSYVEGFGKVKGYYREYQATDWGDKQVMCKSLVVTSGTEPLVNHFREMVKSGNSINEIDENNNLLMNVNLDSIPVEMRKKIAASTIDNQVELGVIRPTLVGRGVSKCFSFVEIVSVE